MSTPKMTRAVQNLFRQISQMAHTLTKGTIRWLLRGLLILGRRPLASKAGFVLPTTVLLLLVVTLTVGAIGFRTYTRSQQSIGERQQRVIYNAATPAIDRSKAKLEFLFNGNRDRRSGGVLPEKQLLGMMLNDGVTNGVPRYPATGPDPYTFPDEERIDINGDGKKDNAWVYETEPDASNKSSRITYSIIFDAPDANATEAPLTLLDSTRPTLLARAERLLVRNAPLSNNTQTNPACTRNTGDDAGSSLLSEQGGWFEDQVDTTILRKNFQVDAYVLPLVNGEPDSSNTVATLEFQQDRESTQGFRWAAWFRNDIEVFPGPEFNWNGAMHTEGNYFIAGKFKSFMVSDPDSCLYKENASRMSTPVVQANPDRNQPYFQGQFIEGEIRKNIFDGSNRIDLWNGERTQPIKNKNLTVSTDSIVDGSTPADYALDPVRLHTEDVSVNRGFADSTGKRTTNWEAGDFVRRLVNKESKKPYLDDTFRADNRYGPKPTVGYNDTPLTGAIGTPIVGNLELTDEKEGLDGYWERRARTDGMRIIVGQRLELGDPSGWGGPTGSETDDRKDVSALDNEPLRPWPKVNEKGCTGSRCNEARQRRSLWDNLAAVQATAIYHKASGLDYPAVCLATTVHPGTAGTLDKSATFENLAFGFTDAFAAPYKGNDRVISDFFRGRGTNGWQYSLPDETTLKTPGSPLVKSLHNLAYFAGDPLGGAPSFTPVQNSGSQGVFPHPFPSMAMWGDFSMLRRVLGTSYSAATYNALSFADKSTLHTAACMLSMLAYNVDYLNKFTPADAPEAVIGQVNATLPASGADGPYWQGLRGHIRAIDAMIYDTLSNDDDGKTAGVPEKLRKTGATKAPGEIKKLTKSAMDGMAWIAGTSGSEASNDPETYVRLLEFWRDTATDATFKEQLTKEIALARMIITKEQVARDRKYGFAGRYADDGNFLLSDQCDTWYRAASSDYSVFTDSFKSAAKSEPLIRLCSDRPRYPVLYSIFPLEQHGDVGNTDIIPNTNGQRNKFMVRDKQDNGNAIAGRGDSTRNFNYLSGSSPAGTINKNVQYESLNDSDIADIAAKPRELGGLGFGGVWTVPTQSVADGATPNGLVLNSGAEVYNLVKVCPATGDWDKVACSSPTKLRTDKAVELAPFSGPRYRIPFKDAALMNGRELMSVRVLNLDLDLMRTSTFGSDYWLPKSGIIYAFREDAVSEANIVRPTVQTWTNCNNVDKILSVSTCRMDTSSSGALDSKDPPLNPRSISPKPVDFYPDPDRRPYGFRLRNGAALWRGNLVGSEIDDKADPPGRGLSFITHNPVYIQGYFNLHRAPNQTSLTRENGLEEFEQKVNTTENQFETTGAGMFGFYDRTDLDEDFADRRKDQWRPTEILGDAITILSTHFCDGSIEDGIITTGGGSNGELNKDNFVDVRYGCPESSGMTSYLNQNRPTEAIPEVNKVRWMRSTIADAFWQASLSNSEKAPRGRAESPVYIFRNGDPMSVGNSGTVTMAEYPGSSDKYEAMLVPGDAKRPLIEVRTDGIQVNSILVSSLIPSRAGQSYGGLHNFPRFIENWDKFKRTLYFSGAFLQLNFSTYATAPFDLEQWEPGLPAPVTGDKDNEWLDYYGAPERSWGFDVALKYAPPGPVAERFRTPEPTRSEFYSEPSADDPYIELLEPCAQDPSSCGA